MELEESEDLPSAWAPVSAVLLVPEPVRDRVVDVLSQRGFRLVQAADRDDLTDKVESLRPEVVFSTDLGDPRGPGTPLPQRFAMAYGAPVVQLLLSPDPPAVAWGRRAGAVDFVRLDTLRGPFDPALARAHRIVLDRLTEREARAQLEREVVAALPVQGRRVLVRVCQGSSQGEIAQDLGIKVRAVEHHLSHLRSALGASTLQLGAVGARCLDPAEWCSPDSDAELVLDMHIRQALALLAGGRTAAQAAGDLFVGVRTLDRGIEPLAALGAGGYSGAVARYELAAIRHKLRSPEAASQDQAYGSLREALGKFRAARSSFRLWSDPQSTLVDDGVAVMTRAVSAMKAREVEVWAGILVGESTRQTAVRICRSPETVGKLSRAVLSACGTANHAELTAFVLNADPELLSFPPQLRQFVTETVGMTRTEVTTAEWRLLEYACAGVTGELTLAAEVNRPLFGVRKSLSGLQPRFGSETWEGAVWRYGGLRRRSNVVLGQLDAAAREELKTYGTAAMEQLRALASSAPDSAGNVVLALPPVAEQDALRAWRGFLPLDREIFQLRVSGATLTDIAVLLDRPEETVRRRLGECTRERFGTSNLEAVVALLGRVAPEVLAGAVGAFAGPTEPLTAEEARFLTLLSNGVPMVQARAGSGASARGCRSLVSEVCRKYAVGELAGALARCLLWHSPSAVAEAVPPLTSETAGRGQARCSVPMSALPSSLTPSLGPTLGATAAARAAKSVLSRG